MDLSSVAAGLGLGLSLIIAIGAQNVFVLRQGIRREHVFAVAAVCAVSDLVLIVVGVSGIGAVLDAVPWLVDVVRWVGAAFLVGYGLLAARRAWRPSGEALEVREAAEADAAALATSASDASPAAPASPSPSAARGDADGASGRPGTKVRVTSAAVAAGHPAHAQRGRGLAAVIGTCLALTWLNPHVYLDTVFLLGSVANTHGDGRWAFALGAGAASLIWFFALAYGARLLGRVLTSPRAWRVLDAIIAVVMIALGISLVLPR
ncbi:LysE/ArgO family amino acid transporter [Agromyces sp. G08B096]|uniref:LysE/ArgO family amino acid transporter n=1 Tax=Agromyces sp. G08B096 TaxID=3156399 RepID=A0AAU7W556_9MICO